MKKIIKAHDISNFNIYYEDTDFSGFVYHANYLKFFDRAREHMLGIPALKGLFEQGYHFVVSRIQLRYKAPARFGDTIAVSSKAEFSGSPRVLITQAARLDSGIILVEGEIELVLLGEKNLPARMPSAFLAHMAATGGPELSQE